MEVNENLPEHEKNEIFDKNRIVDEDNGKKISPPGLSLRINEFVNLTEMFDCVTLAYGKIKKVGLSLWDNHVDSDNSFVVDLALGIKANNIMLNALNFKSEKMNKINRYLELIEEYY